MATHKEGKNELRDELLYTTIAIESLSYSTRKVLKKCDAFSSDDSILKIFYRALNKKT